MLYINAEVNGHPVKAFVDSGAQATIMSPDCAKACGIMRLIDVRYEGVAKGVGTAKILGRVHHAEIKIGDAIMPCAFTVMEGKDVDLLFGLDMLKRYKAKIDLEKNALCFQGIEVPFLPESEIPKSFEESVMNEPTVSGPNGTEIGAKSGAVRPAGARAAGSSAVASGSESNATPVQAAPPAQAQPTPPAHTTTFPQEAIDQLQSFGFSKDDAIQALTATGGNVEFAAGLLFAKMND
jgi:DNA damage-inducible protein 1